MIELFTKYSFLQHALYSGLMASIVCGIIGTIIIEKKMVMMSGGVAHASFGGIGLGYYLEIEPVVGALFFSIFSAVLMVILKRKTCTDSDTLMGIFWSVGMALGIIFIALTPGYPPDITSYLFGDILTVAGLDLRLMALLTGLVVIVVISLFNYWKAYLFDEEFSSVMGIKTIIFDYLLYILIALSIVVLIRVVGIILVIALLTAPSATARLITSSLKKVMILAIIFGSCSIICGLWLSYLFDLASGAAIIITCGLVYILIAVVKNLFIRV